MSLLLSRLPKLCCGKPGLIRYSLLILSNGFSTSLRQTPPCTIITARYCGEGLNNLVIMNANGKCCVDLEKKVPTELVEENDATVTIGASNGWVATFKDGVVRLQDDLNPFASDTNPKRIPLPPLVTLPGCQTQVVTNVAMSSPSPEDEDCVVAVKFLGPQLSFCRPAQSKTGWTNVRIENPCFFPSRVMFCKRDDMFCLLGSGGHLIGSWDLGKHTNKPKIQRLRFQNLPELTRSKQERLHSCCTSEHLVESRSTGETFLVKLYRKATANGRVKMKTRALMVFKLEEEGNAIYTQDIGGLCIFISKCEPFCVPASSFPGMCPNSIELLDVDERAIVNLHYSSTSIRSVNYTSVAPYHIPPQNIV
ncbi:PREDICTED: uncharacterized protein LOC104730637 [Camelina sativa]|uniref:Uncharacterized protein LOC104730637 n=1 Tax=Camelina sativa TaxID=90675 RepID=A0ABM0UYF2_CAMSA|nr:PREDICTED: uncharacterized protein LOC104730637 [Camelina sativa]